MENEELFNVFESSNSISEVLRKLNISDNSNNWKKIKLLAIEIGFNIETYKNRKKKFCLNCGKELKRGQNKFCSNSCSATFNNKNRIVSDETKEKISKTLLAYKPIKNEKIVRVKKITKRVRVEKTTKRIRVEKNDVKNFCKFCGTEIKKNKKYCTSKCSNKHQHIKSYEYFLANPNKFNCGNYSPVNFKDFFMVEQNNKCSICGCEPIWNGKEIQFVLDHIDGDASNNSRENLRMICPNCDSQTDTFKSKNKNSTRRNYWKEKIIRDIKNEQ